MICCVLLNILCYIFSVFAMPPVALGRKYSRNDPEGSYNTTHQHRSRTRIGGVILRHSWYFAQVSDCAKASFSGYVLKWVSKNQACKPFAHRLPKVMWLRLSAGPARPAGAFPQINSAKIIGNARWLVCLIKWLIFGLCFNLNKPCTLAYQLVCTWPSSYG